MRLTHLLSKRIYIARLATTTGDKMAFVTVTSDMSHIQPIDRSNTEVSEGVFNKTYRLYMDGDGNIQEGDRLRDEDNNYYTVMADGVSRRTFGSFDYLIVILSKNE